MDGGDDQVLELDAENGTHLQDKNNTYLKELMAEKQELNSKFTHSCELLAAEISRVHLGQEKEKLVELHNDKPTKVSLKVKIPAKEFPKFNFIGKILGPKGNSLRRLQEETGCRMAVFGRGSMRDKEKEEELRKQGGKYAHLNEDLHVYVEAFGHPVDVYQQLAHALFELRRHLVPDYNDEITQQQVQELAYLNGTIPPTRGRGRGGFNATRGIGGGVLGGPQFGMHNRYSYPSYGYGGNTLRGGLARNFGGRGSRGGSMGGRGARNSTNVAASGGTSVASGGYHDSCQYDQQDVFHAGEPSFQNQTVLSATSH
jgi:hypothetical protein